MKRIGIAVLSAASLMAAGTAMAAEPQWTYLQAGWIQGDGFDDYGKSDGFEIKGSVGIENFHLGLGYVDGEIADDDFNEDIDFDGFTINAGYHQAISSSGNTQLVVDLSYFDIDYDIDGAEGYSADNKGIGLGLGLRSTVLNNLELEGMITYVRGETDIFFGDDEDYTDTVLRVGARYHWTGNFSTGVTMTLNDSTAGYYYGGDTAVFDLRWSFGDLLK